MDQNYLNLLENIKGEKHIGNLVSKKINNLFIERGFSLAEIFQLSIEDFQKFPGIGVTKVEHFLALKDEISHNKLFFENYYRCFIDETVLYKQINYDEDIQSNFIQCLEEIVLTLKSHFEFADPFLNLQEKKRFNHLINFTTAYYGLFGSEPKEMSEIGKEFSVSSETVRLVLFDSKDKKDLRNIFVRNQTVLNIGINTEFIDYLNELIKNTVYSCDFPSQFGSIQSIRSYNLVKKIVELFDFSLISVEHAGITFHTIVPKEMSIIYKSHISILIGILGDGFSFTEEALKNEMIAKIKGLRSTAENRFIIAHGLDGVIFKSLLNSYYKLEKIGEGGVEKHQFKWSHLSSQIAKITRILFESSVVMSKEEILEEFQNRELSFGLEISVQHVNDLHIRSTDKIHPHGRAGFWFYDENMSEAINTLAIQVSQDIITQFNGKFLYSDFLSFTTTSEFYQYYETSAIRSNVMLCSRPTVEDPNLFIHNEFVEQYSNYKLTSNRNKYLGNNIIKSIVELLPENSSPILRSELLTLVIAKLNEKGIQINTKHNVSQYFIKLVEQGILKSIEENDKNYLELDYQVLANFDIEKIGKKTEPAYKSMIRAKAIYHLKQHQKEKLAALVELVLPLAPIDLSRTNIYKIFNDEKLFKKEMQGKETWVLLDSSLLPVPKEMHVEVSEEETEVLGDRPMIKRTLFDKTELKRAVIEELYLEKNTYFLNREIIFGTFESFLDIVLNKESNSMWGRRLIQSLYENFCTKTDYYDRQLCLIELVASFETFLKLLSPKREQLKSSSFWETIQTMPTILDLYLYKKKEKSNITDRQKNNFSYIMNQLKYLADINRHDRSNQDLEMGNMKIMKSIVDFTALYLYILYLEEKF